MAWATRTGKGGKEEMAPIDLFGCGWKRVGIVLGFFLCHQASLQE